MPRDPIPGTISDRLTKVLFLEIHAGYSKLLLDVTKDPCMPRTKDIGPDQVVAHLVDPHDVDDGVLVSLKIAEEAWRRKDYSVHIG